MSHWNASNYQKRVAERIATVKPQWITMPSGEKFYLRKVAPLLSSALAGHMPSALTKQAVDAWKERGVEGFADTAVDLAANMSKEELRSAGRETARFSRIIQQSCVIPLLSNDDPSTIEFTDEWKADAVQGLQELDKDFDHETFDPKLLVVDPRELDEADAEFLLYRWATGLTGSVGLKGGGAVNSNDLLRFPRKLNRGSRTRADGKKQRRAS